MLSLRLVPRCARWRSWLFSLCLTANLTVATPTAQSAPGSSGATSAMWVAQDDDMRSLERFAVNVRNGTFGQQRGSRDSLRNGAIIGAAIGAAAVGAFAALLCNAYQEEGGASCWPDTLRFAGIGGAIGAGTGLAIDRARSQRSATVRFVIKF